MNQKQTTSRSLLLLIVVICVGPMVLAWLFQQNPEWLAAGTNNGHLLTPAVSTERLQWRGIDTFSQENIAELEGHWVLLNLIPNQQCNNICQDALHKTKQIRLMLNKGLIRVRRASVFLQTVDVKPAQTRRQDDSRLLQLSVTKPLRDKILKIINAPIPDGTIMLMDPLGNLMMVYAAGFDPYLIKKDLNKLLRVSQIG